jgi:hypothetical protein
MREALDWDRPLRWKRGAQQRLRGIDVYYDFRWSDHFGNDPRVQFRGGQDLADVVRDDCPEGKRAALLLTDRGDVDQGAQETTTHYVVVINLPEYVDAVGEPGTATVYLARMLGNGITRARRFSELSEDEAEKAAAWLDDNLDMAALQRWAGDSEERLSLLGTVAADGLGEDDDDEGDRASAAERVLDALQSLEEIPEEVATAIAAVAAASDDLDGRIEMLWALTQDDDGRRVAAQMLQARVSDRLTDARRAVDQVEELLETAGETEVQGFLENNPWVLGLDYAIVRPRKTIVRGAVDFLLERFDGFHDLLELKSPNDPLFDVAGRDEDARSASRFRLSKQLALALAQVHAYRDILREESVHEKMYGLRNTRDPKIIILIGKASDLNHEEQRVLHELNCSLHDVEIVPFDLVARRARLVLDNAERYLLTADEQADD